jgi:hypothetical protein
LFRVPDSCGDATEHGKHQIAVSVYEKRLPTDLALITQQLVAYRESLEGIVVESTYN